MTSEQDKDKPSATYRGFRHQALYILHRILTDANSQEVIYQPEGKEDLAIRHQDGTLLEALQVKDYRSDLTISSLKTFFGRYQEHLLAGEPSPFKLVSYGELGPELQGAINNKSDTDLKSREAVLTKMAGWKRPVDLEYGRQILDALIQNVEKPEPQILQNAIDNALTGTVVGADLKTANDLLIAWIYYASEHTERLNRKSLFERLDQIGKFLTTREGAYSEWFRSITPLQSTSLTPERTKSLQEEFRKGVRSRWEHVLAGADCIRTERLDEIRNSFSEHSLVVIRGASGQGKSALALRYLHDFGYEGMRFHVKVVDDRQHALRIAQILASHAKQLKVSALILLDVSPSDRAWAELARDLSSQGLQVLVSIREEDFHRGSQALSSEIYGEVSLNSVERQEAEHIYNKLTKGRPGLPLNFQEAWKLFQKKNGGPLLEFTYFAHQGDFLDRKISAQVSELQQNVLAGADQLTQVHLEILALSAVANETGARISFKGAISEVGTSPLVDPLKRLEKEYLLRIVDLDQQPFVEGLHALRSSAITKALFRGDLPSHLEMVCRALPYIHPEDFEIFLLGHFGTLEGAYEKLVEQLLKISEFSWAQAAAICRALLWEGLNQYEKKNRSTLIALIKQAKDGWGVLCDSFVGMDGEECSKILQSMESLSGRKIINLGPKDLVYAPLVAWLENANKPNPPISSEDWNAIGEIAYWIAKKNILPSWRTEFFQLLPASLPPDIRSDAWASFCSGMCFLLGEEDFKIWQEPLIPSFVDLHLKSSDAALVRAISSDEVKVWFWIPTDDSPEKKQAGNDEEADYDFNDAAMEHFARIAGIFPATKWISTNAIGLLPLENILPENYNPCYKRIDSQAQPDVRSVRMNSIFQNLVNYRHLRPETWTDYWKEAFDSRKLALQQINSLIRFLAKISSKTSISQTTLKSWPPKILKNSHEPKPPFYLPKCSVDHFGFGAETKAKSNAYSPNEHCDAQLQEWRKYFQKYRRGLKNLFSFSSRFVDAYSDFLRDGNWPEDDSPSRLSLINLADSLKALRPMQRHFRHWSKEHVSPGSLSLLDSNETKALKKLWRLIFSMVNFPERHFPHLDAKIAGRTKTQKTAILEGLDRELSERIGEPNSFSITKRKLGFGPSEETHLFVVLDFQSLAVQKSHQKTPILAIKAAIRSCDLLPHEEVALELIWKNLTVVSLVNGRAIYPAWSTTSLYMLCLEADKNEVPSYQCTSLPVAIETFRMVGFEAWETPGVETCKRLTAALMSAIFLSSRYAECAVIADQENASESEKQRLVSALTRQIWPYLQEARTCLELLKTEGAFISRNTKNHEFINEFITSSEEFLDLVSENKNDILSSDELANWLEQKTTQVGTLQPLLSDIMEEKITAAVASC